jgi:hypothetical protein
MKLLSLFLLILSIYTGCTVYRSPERKDFESDSPNFHAQNLMQVSCSGTSLKSQASASRLITVLAKDNSSESTFLWEYIIDNSSYFESDNLKGAYCVFEKNT